MRKLLLSFSALTVAIAVDAQITINESDVIEYGDQISTSSDTMPSIQFPVAGVDMTWDLSGLNDHEQSTQSFGGAEWFNFGALFPTANFASIDADGFETYFSKDATGLRMQGFAGDLFGTGPISVRFNPEDEMIRFPTNYDDSYVTNSQYSLTILGSDLGVPVDSIKNQGTTEKNVYIDGWGTLTTPYGTFEVLRMNTVTTAYDSTWTYLFGQSQLFDNSMETTYSVEFWSNDPATKYPVAILEHDDNGNTSFVQWLNSAPVAGQEELSSAFEVYPNPATSTLNFDANAGQITAVELFDVAGRSVYSNTNVVTNSVDVSSFKNGLYVYQISMKDGTVFTGQVTVQH